MSTLRKVTAIAPSNIAFIKYWGAEDLDRVLPVNPSISMTLSHCTSRTTAEPRPGAADDEILLVDDSGSASPAPEAFAGRIRAHLDRLREWAGRTERLRIATRNSFPAAAGLASSASGFAALTLAVTHALGRGDGLDPAELSDLARRSGSGSAARSVLGGYVEWPAGGVESPEQGNHAVQIAPAAHWDLRDVIALVEAGAKAVSSLDGHRRAATSPYFGRRQELLPDRLEAVREAVARRDFERLGPVIEEEAIDLHLIAMSSRPPIFYWSPGTLEVLAAVRSLRREGVAAWATMDAGANVHVICPPRDEPAVVACLESLPGVRSVLRDGVGPGPRVGTDEPLI